ncbi:conjugated polyketone reductase C1 [Pholiota conissans]|uniref:Conjugated polyketone reductase C1 n=1 Tax=Pholiota conissans TaxID=109636 RepID=A0A9P6CY35_9AGAR|nr:conjugated polyketone reductase C1 [Pholiota conissans]
MTNNSTLSFPLLDGTRIPWLGWGNGTGDASKTAIESGKLALENGIHHLDTAQNYNNEQETGEAIRQSSIPREEVYVTSKLSGLPRRVHVPFDEIRSSIQGSLDKLGLIPNLYLIHSPYVAERGNLKAVWQILENLKDEGKLHSIGVSNFRPQDLEAILDGAKYKPVVNQIEYHPYVLTHLEPLLALHKQHGILTQSFGALTPLLRHPTGGPLKPILERIAARIAQDTGKPIDAAIVLLLWTRAQGVCVVTASGNPERIKRLGEVAVMPDLLTEDEVDEISRVGRGIQFRYYNGQMEEDFPLPDLPSQ